MQTLQYQSLWSSLRTVEAARPSPVSSAPWTSGGFSLPWAFDFPVSSLQAPFLARTVDTARPKRFVTTSFVTTSAASEGAANPSSCFCFKNNGHGKRFSTTLFYLVEGDFKRIVICLQLRPFEMISHKALPWAQLFSVQRFANSEEKPGGRSSFARR